MFLNMYINSAQNQRDLVRAILYTYQEHWHNILSNSKFKKQTFTGKEVSKTFKNTLYAPCTITEINKINAVIDTAAQVTVNFLKHSVPNQF